MVKRRHSSNKQFLDRYEKEASIYDKTRSGDYFGFKKYQSQLRILRKVAKKHNCTTICEAGCGTGLLLLPMAKAGFTCTGFDPSPEMLKVLTQKQKAAGLKIKTKIGDIENISFKDNSFDMVYTMHVLMHLPNGYKKAFAEMYRITKPGGVIVCDFQNLKSPSSIVIDLLRPRAKGSRKDSFGQLKKFFSKYQHTVHYRGSYPQLFFKIPVFKYVFGFLEDVLPFPRSMRQQFLFVVKK